MLRNRTTDVRPARTRSASRGLLRTALLACLGLIAPVANAADLASGEDPGLTLRGFGTLGLTRSSSADADFVRDLSQPRGSSGGHWTSRVDSVLGLQANWRLTGQLEAVAQAVSRYRYDQSYRPELMWAFLKYDPNANLSLRAGRLGTDFFMQADSRLVGYSYLTIRPSVDYFTHLPFSHIDGVDGLLTLPWGAGLARAKLFAGRMQSKLALADRIWDMDGSTMKGGYLSYQEGPWLVRGGYARMEFSSNPPVASLLDGLRSTGVPSAMAAADALGTQGKVSDFYSLGAVYDHGPLQLQLQLNRIRQESASFQNSRAGNFLAGYRMGQFTPFAGYSWLKSTPKTLDTGLPPSPLTLGTASLLADSGGHQHTITLGLRWDVTTNVDLKLQYDTIRGSSASLFPYRWEKAGWNGRTNVLSAVVDFVF